MAHGESHDGVPRRGPTRQLERAGEVAARVFGERDEVTGEHEAPGRGVDEDGIAGAEVLLPVGFAELVADQLVGGRGVRDAEQRHFGDAHEEHAFFAREVVLAHEGLDGALLIRAGADAGDELAGAREDELALGGRERRLRKEIASTASVSSRVHAAVMRARGGLDGGREFGGEDVAQGGVSERGRHLIWGRRGRRVV